MPVEIDGVTFSPGDLVVADLDGVVVVPRRVEPEVVRRAWEKVHAENVVRDAIAGGMSAREVQEVWRSIVKFSGEVHLILRRSVPPDLLRNAMNRLKVQEFCGAFVLLSRLLW